MGAEKNLGREWWGVVLTPKPRKKLCRIDACVVCITPTRQCTLFDKTIIRTISLLKCTVNSLSLSLAHKIFSTISKQGEPTSTYYIENFRLLIFSQVEMWIL